MAFSLFGKRGTDSETEKENESAGESSTSEALTEKRGFFDRMRQAVTRTRDSFAESIGSVLALTREIDETSLAELEAVLLAADIGSATARTIIENLRQRGLRQGIEGGEELKRLLKIELKQVLDGVATVDAVPAATPEVVMMVGVNGTGKTTTTGKLAAFYRGQERTVLLCAADTFRAAAIEQLEVWAARSRDADHQDQDGRRSISRAVRRVHGGEGARDRCADCGYGGTAAHQDRPDEGAGQDAANGGEAGPGRAAPDAAGDGCDHRAERVAAGKAVHRGGAGDGNRADQAGWDGEGRDRAGDCDRAGAAGEVCGRGREDGRHSAVRQWGVCRVDGAVGARYQVRGSRVRQSSADTLGIDVETMQRALELARATVGLASPNPQVGCVLVRDGVVVGEGAHVYDDFDHAEIVALKQAGERARGATAYVTLEPCSHHGRTGPCADALIAAGVRRVVAATVGSESTGERTGDCAA